MSRVHIELFANKFSKYPLREINIIILFLFLFFIHFTLHNADISLCIYFNWFEL